MQNHEKLSKTSKKALKTFKKLSMFFSQKIFDPKRKKLQYKLFVDNRTGSVKCLTQFSFDLISTISLVFLQQFPRKNSKKVKKLFSSNKIFYHFICNRVWSVSHHSWNQTALSSFHMELGKVESVGNFCLMVALLSETTKNRNNLKVQIYKSHTVCYHKSCI